jgi:hypothetical protein
MKHKFNVKDLVILRSCNLVGEVVSIATAEEFVRYEVAVESLETGLPAYLWVYQNEIEKTEDTNTMGFKKK